MPGARFKRQATEWRQQLDDLAKTPFDLVKAGIVRLPHHIMDSPFE